MRKRRVLALFLALSMAFSSNGFTALAAGEDPVVSVQADSLEEADETEDAASEENGEAVNENDASDESGENGAGNDAAEENGENGIGNDATEGNDETGSENDASEGNGEATAPEEGGQTDDGSDVSNEADGEEIGNDVDTPEEADGPETDINDGEPAEAANSTNAAGVRMCTFTDDTGMTVTYDLDASSSYNYTIVPEEDDEGNPTGHKVLTAITETVNGEEQLVTLSGVIKLRAPKNEGEFFDTIGATVFKGNQKIEYVILPENVTAIEEGAFADCTQLRGINLPSGLERIQDDTFAGCTNLTQLSIPKGVISIGNRAFSGDTSLFMVYVKDYVYSSMEAIGEKAFEKCTRLEKFGSDTDFSLPGNLAAIGAWAFADCHAIKKVILPDTVKESYYSRTIDEHNVLNIDYKGGLDVGVFQNCIGLTEVTLSGAYVIPEDAFSGCSNLLSVKFANGNTTIRENAFEKCIRLGEAIFSNTIDYVGGSAFDSCSNLRYVEIPNASVKIVVGADGEHTFPNNNEYTLWMRGHAGTAVETYAKPRNNIRFIAYQNSTDELFKYVYQCLPLDVAGKVTFACEDKTTDPNAKNSGNGVRAGTKIYASVINTSSLKYVDGSLRCNGVPIGKDKNGEYVFTMPVGGAYVTAEFERTGAGDSDKTNGTKDDIKYELSNGSNLKVGQTTRMFLIDTSTQAGNSVIPASKIKFETANKTIVDVSKDGTIKALAEGTAYITASVRDVNNKLASLTAVIEIVGAEIDKLRFKPFAYDTEIIDVTKSGEDGEVDGIVLDKVDVENSGTTFTLLVTAYTAPEEGEENMSAALKWTTSDSKVAKIAKSSTDSTESQNTITIPKGASGVAVITATATKANPKDSENKTVQGKFIVRVQDSTPKLVSSTVTLNPYQSAGAKLEIIGASYAPIPTNVELRSHDNKDVSSGEFILDDNKTDVNYDNNTITCYINARSTNLTDGTYNASVFVEVEDNYYYLPLTIKVKRSIPNPKVSIAKNQPKMNLFYQNGGTQMKDGEEVPLEVVPVISNLGDVDPTKITYDLENLSNGVDDVKFMQNFEIADPTKCVITRTNTPMQYTSKNKPVVTGYLVLTFGGYEKGVNQRKYKITIPTKTTKPSYKLERTSDTFKSDSGIQQVSLSLLDKNNKKDPKVDLSDPAVWEVYKDADSTTSAITIDSVDDDGKIVLNVNTSGDTGKISIAVHNKSWDGDQVIKYQYTAKISSKKTVFKLSKSTVTLNKYFEGETETVTLKSNQYGITVNDDIVFERPPRLSEAKEFLYDEITPEWNAETQEITVSASSSAENGTYKYTFEPLGEDGNKVTLTVRVIGVAPTVSLKGAAKLNKDAGRADSAELTMNFKNLPDESRNSMTATFEYATTKEDDYDTAEEDFKFDVDGANKKLSISLQNTAKPAGTYTVKMMPTYDGCDNDNLKPVKFKIKVYNGTISVSLKAKGKLNLLKRYDETYSDKTAVPATVNPNVYGGEIYNVADYGEAVPRFAGGNAKTNGNVNATAIALDMETPIAVQYECDEGIVTKRLESISEAEDGTETRTNAVAINVDDVTKQTTTKYEFTATEKPGYKITSITAYKTTDKNDPPEGSENVNEWNAWDGVPTLNLGTPDLDAGTLTIEEGTSLEDISGITIVVTSEEITYTVTIKDVTEEEDAKNKVTIQYAAAEDEAGLAGAILGTPDNDGKVVLSYGNLLAIKLTPEAEYTVESFDAEGDDDLIFNKTTVDGLGDVYLSNKKITSDIEISISIKAAESYTITFNRQGEHAQIKKADGQTAIVDDTDSVEEGLDYTFVVVTDAGLEYSVDAGYDDEESPLQVEGPTEESVGDKTKYTFKITNIEGDITINLTDVYTVKISNSSTGAVTGFEYGLKGEPTEYTQYPDVGDDPNQPPEVPVPYGENLKIKIAKGDKNVVLFDEDETAKILPGTDSDATHFVYTIPGNGNKNLKIAVEYTITAEGNATVTSGGNVITDTTGQPILSGEDLTFTVTPDTGYVVTGVKYKLASAANWVTLTANADDSYTISNTNIIDNITINVETVSENQNHHAVYLKVVGATVNIDGDESKSFVGNDVSDMTDVLNEEAQFVKRIPITGADDAGKTFTFTVQTVNKLRYVGTNADLSTDSLVKDAATGAYTFTFPTEETETVTTIYVSATPLKDVTVNFAGLSVTSGDTIVTKATVHKVTFAADSNYDDDSKKNITTEPVTAITDKEDKKVYFIIREASGYTISGVTVGSGATLRQKECPVSETVAGAAAPDADKTVTIYELTLPYADTVTVNVSLSSQGGDEPVPDEPEEKEIRYEPKSCIIYTPVVSNLKDTVVAAKIYDASRQAPTWEDDQSSCFNIEVIDGLLYVMPKKNDDDGNPVILKSNTEYPVKIWLAFENYRSDGEGEDGGVWVSKTIKIKTAQVLPKVTTSTNMINLYQSNTGYTSTFIVRLKDGSVGKLEGISFDAKDNKAKESLEIVEEEVQGDGSLKVTVGLQSGALYAANSTNKVKMYVQFEDQAENTAGTAITMNVKVNK